MKNRLKILLLLTLLPFGLYSQTFQVKVVGISDGDTFTGLNRDNLQLKFRIHGIDAPEKKQAFGTKAREHLGSLIFKQNVTVDVSDQDKWGRYIARVATDDGRDVGKEMIQAGLAWHYKHFDNILNKDLKTSIRACSVICHDIRVEVLELAHLRKENGEIFKNLKNTIIAMKLKIKKTNFISSIDSWYRFAPPERGDSQWVDGRSAKEFAKYMLSEAGKMPSEIEKYIKSLGWECHDCDCFPEHVTNFLLEYGTGSGRHHDALFVSKDWVVGVESKVSESFDSRIEDWLEKGKKNKDGGKNRKARIKESLRLITGQAYSDKDIESEAILDLRYQLISATVGTILEAKNHNIRKAALLVVEFQGNVLKEKGYMKNINTNSKDYQSFLDFLQIGEKNDLERKIEVKIDIDYTLSIWFKKIPINVLGPKYSVAE